MKVKRPETVEIKPRNDNSLQQLNEDLRRLELSQYRTIILKYPKETKKIAKEMHGLKE